LVGFPVSTALVGFPVSTVLVGFITCQIAAVEGTGLL
jgi:hypothetical protein